MRKRRLVIIFVGIALMISMGYPNRLSAQVNIRVGINVPPPPSLIIPVPPPVIVVPGTYVYFAPDVEADIFFYHGYWYRPYQGRWYKSVNYNGSWVYIVPDNVPAVLLRLPPDFRHVPHGHQRIPYGQLKKNWRSWEKERYWDRPKYPHGGKREYQRVKGGGKGKHKD